MIEWCTALVKFCYIFVKGSDCLNLSGVTPEKSRRATLIEMVYVIGN